MKSRIPRFINPIADNELITSSKSRSTITTGERGKYLSNGKNINALSLSPFPPSLLINYLWVKQPSIPSCRQLGKYLANQAVLDRGSPVTKKLGCSVEILSASIKHILIQSVIASRHLAYIMNYIIPL
jgi:hypothetical protein